jgi:phospholipase C
VKPDSLVDGHPASSTLDLFEAMLKNIVAKLQAQPNPLKETALFVTFDEGGGYWTQVSCSRSTSSEMARASPCS